jgi:hypothetical protein
MIWWLGWSDEKVGSLILNLSKNEQKLTILITNIGLFKINKSTTVLSKATVCRFLEIMVIKYIEM